MGREDNRELRTLDLSMVDEDSFVREAIHNDMDILLGQLQIPTDKLSDDQRKTILDVI